MYLVLLCMRNVHRSDVLVGASGPGRHISMSSALRTNGLAGVPSVAIITLLVLSRAWPIVVACHLGVLESVSLDAIVREKKSRSKLLRA